MNKKQAFVFACFAAALLSSCNETIEWSYEETCEAGAKRCIESRVMACKDGAWIEEAECKGETPICDIETHACVANRIAACKADEKKCDGNKSYACSNGDWTLAQDCGSDKECNPQTYACDEKAIETECNPGQSKCIGGKLISCGDAGMWDEGTACATQTAHAESVCRAVDDDHAQCADECDDDYKLSDDQSACVPSDAMQCRIHRIDDADIAQYREAGATEYADWQNCADADGADKNGVYGCDAAGKECHIASCKNGFVLTNGEQSDGTSVKSCRAPEPEDCSPDGLDSAIADGHSACLGLKIVSCSDGQTTTADADCATQIGNAHATCIVGNDLQASCGFECNPDYALSDDKTSCLPAHAKQCRINAVGETQVAQYRSGMSSEYTEWNDCASAQNAVEHGVYGCDDGGAECALVGCADGYDLTAKAKQPRANAISIISAAATETAKRSESVSCTANPTPK